MNVVIIGSGIAGLASAVRLAIAGHEVTVFESNAYPGGKLSEMNINGFRFDAGPSLFTLPNLVTDLFKLAGKKPSDYFEYEQIEKACNYFYEDGTTFTAYHDKQKFANELTAKLGLDNTKPLFNYLKKSAKKYELTAPLFIEKSLHKLNTYTNLNTLKAVANLASYQFTKTMNDVNEGAFKDPRLVQYFNRFATYNGSSPYRAPGMLTMIPHLEHNIGTFFPKGGMIAITNSIYKLALELGVKFVFNSNVEEIKTEGVKNNKEVKGVMVKGAFIPADLVISNADIHPTYTKLLKNEPQPEKLLSQEKSSSALIFYWGINKQFPQLDLHNILFSSDYKTEFKHIFSYKSIYYDPTIYINITSKYKPDDAPQGCENWFVMINVPANITQNWDAYIAQARKQIITKINRLLKSKIEAHIVAEEQLNPLTIESKTSSFGGSLYG
ncbi:MAG: 1-hydroxycarotenoid 3,4-desaturase CrtD, partial [Bacteroidia bacterium]